MKKKKNWSQSTYLGSIYYVTEMRYEQTDIVLYRFSRKLISRNFKPKSLCLRYADKTKSIASYVVHVSKEV